MPNVPRARRDRATARFYDTWKRRYLERACAPDQWRIRSTPDTGPHVVSEGQGYGMVIVALMAGYDVAAQTTFDGLARYYLAHPSNVDARLMAWAQDVHCHELEGGDSATDGDLDVAYALLLADAQWGSAGALDYSALARRILEGILAEDIHPRTLVTGLGDWTTSDAPRYWWSSRPSDWMLAHFRSFGRATGDRRWLAIRRAHLALIARMQRRFAPRTGLLPDFVDRLNRSPRPASPNFLESRDDGSFSWNASRTPWRIGTDAVASGDRRSRRAVKRMSLWIRRRTGERPSRVRAGYSLGGRPLGRDHAMAFTAPFAVAAMSDPGAQRWLDRLWRAMMRTPPEGYYSDGIRLQSMLVASGNWWSP